MNLRQQFRNSPSELCSDDRDMIRILGDMPPESVFELEYLETFVSLVERLGRGQNDSLHRGKP
jgi:hypothetical protein